MTVESIERRLHGVAVYNPDLLSKEELIAHFVARRELLEHLTAELGRPAFEQHQIIIGSRGMGKTTLLRRVGYAVEDDPALSQIWLPLTFPEEQYNVGRLSDLYLNFVDALSDALERRGRREEALLIDSALGSLSREEERRAEAALSLLLETAERIGRRLLLLVDNLDLVMERLEKQPSAQWAFREMLSAQSRLLLIGAMPVAIGATYEYGQPFYDFFQVHELRGLRQEEMRQVLVRLSRETDAPAVERLVETDPARVETLHTLTGGNPRTLVLLFNVLAQGTAGDVRSDLEKLLDHSTPLYKARFESLAPQAQQIVDAVAIHWDPITAGELADKLPLDVNIVSAQLTRLVQQGVLERVDPHPAGKTGFQLAERFFNIWYLMRASRRVRRRLIWLVQFLRLFYGAEQVRSKARELLQRPLLASRTEKLRHAEFCLAIAQLIDDDWPTRSALETDAIRTLLGDTQLSEQLTSMLDLDEADASLRDVVDRERWAEAMRRAIEESKLPKKEKPRALELISSANLSRQQRLQLARQIGRLSKRTRERFLAAAEAEHQALRHRLGDRLASATLRALASGFMNDLGDEQGTIAAAAAFGVPELEAPFAYNADDRERRLRVLLRLTDSAFVKVALADVLLRRGAYEEAVALISAALEREAFSFAYFVQGKTYARAGQYEDAVAVFERVVAADAAWVYGWHELAKVCFDGGKVERAMEAFRQALELDRTKSVLADYGRALLILEKFDEAEPVLREALEKAPDPQTANHLARALVNTDRYAEALAVLQEADHSDPEIRLGEALTLILLHRNVDALPILLELARSGPSAGVALRAATAMLIVRAEEAMDVVAQVLTGSGEAVLGALPELIEFCELAVDAGEAARVRAILEGLELVDWLRPVYEALRIAEVRDLALLKGLAPEVQVPTRRILETWGINETRPDREPRQKPRKRPARRR